MDKTLSVAIIGNTNKKLMEFALEKTLLNLPKCDEILVFSDEPIDLSHNYKFFRLKGEFGIPHYSELVTKQLYKHVETDFCLTIQYDGFAINKNNWRDEFLEFDFIGTPVTPNHQPMKMALSRAKTDLVDIDSVIKEGKWQSGGGGFNIKSKKFLTACGEDAEIKSHAEDRKNPGEAVWYCDDMTLNFFHRERLINEHNLKFADMSTCLNFGCEIATAYDFPFGFHGWYHVGLFLQENEIVYYMENLTRKALTNKERNLETGLFLGFLWGRGLDDLFKYYSKKLDKNNTELLKLKSVWPQKNN